MTSGIHPKNGSIRIGQYEDWMGPQVVDLFVNEYGGEREDRENAYRDFFEHPFQRARGIRLVALDESRVCGFQSFFFWPYLYDGEELQSFQSGNSLVHPEYRGRGIFSRLLGFIDTGLDETEIDLLLGFPVAMSYGSFIRKGWANPLDLIWMGKAIHPLSVIRREGPSEYDFDFEREPAHIETYSPADQFVLSKTPELSAWRRQYSRHRSDYFYFLHQEGNASIQFQLKPGRRGRFKELVIGDIERDSDSPRLLATGLRSLVSAARGHKFLTALTIALNPLSAERSLLKSLRRIGFLPLQRKIHFIVKPTDAPANTTDPSRWWLLRSDIDTW